MTGPGPALFAEQSTSPPNIHHFKTDEGQYIDTSLLEAGVALSGGRPGTSQPRVPPSSWTQPPVLSVGSVSGDALRRRLYQFGGGHYLNVGEVCLRHRAPRTARPARICERRSPRQKSLSTHTRMKPWSLGSRARTARRTRRCRHPVRADLKLYRGFRRLAYPSVWHSAGDETPSRGDHTGGLGPAAKLSETPVRLARPSLPYGGVCR